METSILEGMMFIMANVHPWKFCTEIKADWLYLLVGRRMNIFIKSQQKITQQVTLL